MMKKYNWGIAILRLFLTFLVILNHFWEANDAAIGGTAVFIKLRSIAVPTFMLLSFFLTERDIGNPTSEKIKKRLIRLSVPFFMWGAGSWLVLFLAEKILNLDIIDGFRALFWQLVSGHAYHVNAPLWYMAVLIWLTIIYSIIFILPNKRASFVFIQIIAIVAVILQYSGLNYSLFKDMPFEMKYPLGRVVEVIPYATLGYDIAHLQIYDWLKENKHRATFALWTSLAMTILLLVFGQTSNIAGFGYNGIFRMIVSFSLLTFFYLLPMEHISEDTVKRLKTITAHTFGIYCLHYLVGNVLNIIANRIQVDINKIIFCISLYIICYVIAAVISRIPSRFVRRLVD